MVAAYGILQTVLEKVSARIAVSEYARATLVEHLGGDAVLIPNGVNAAAYEGVGPLSPRPSAPSPRGVPGSGCSSSAAATSTRPGRCCPTASATR